MRRREDQTGLTILVWRFNCSWIMCFSVNKLWIKSVVMIMMGKFLCFTTIVNKYMTQNNDTIRTYVHVYGWGVCVKGCSLWWKIFLEIKLNFLSSLFATTHRSLLFLILSCYRCCMLMLLLRLTAAAGGCCAVWFLPARCAKYFRRTCIL